MSEARIRQKLKILSLAGLLVSLGPPLALSSEVNVCFVPGPVSCQMQIVDLIDAAKTSLMVQEVQLTNPALIRAILEAHRRGVAVQVLLDKSQRFARNSGASELVQKGVPVSIDAPSGIAHNKVVLIDGKIVVGGSFNWSTTADSRTVSGAARTRKGPRPFDPMREEGGLGHMR